MKNKRWNMRALCAWVMIVVLCLPLVGTAEMIEGIEPQTTQAAAAEPPQALTVEPTQAPTAKPTEAPTAKPTEAPTVEPTQAPTVEPTEAPTAKPTEAPTAEPTQAPTAEPTQAPTVEPTEAPTAEPTQAPTAEPTQAPTVEPTQAPTVEPTQAPTVEPTQAPTAKPEPIWVRDEKTGVEIEWPADVSINQAALKVREWNDEALKAALQTALEREEKSLLAFQGYQIQMEGAEFPEKMRISLPIPQDFSEEIAAWYIDENGTAVRMVGERREKQYSFEANRPGLYALTNAKKKPEQEALTAPDPMTVEFLEKVMGLSANALDDKNAAPAAVGSVPVSGKSKMDGTPLSGSGIPSSIRMGWINRLGIQKDIKTTDGRTYSFCGAMVEGSPCVFTGEYEGVVYYSTDGYSAVELGSKRVDLMYWEYFTVTLRNPWFDKRGGEVKAQDARLNSDGTLNYTEKTVGHNKLTYMDVRTYDGEKLNWSATPGADEKGVRYILSKIFVDKDTQNPILPSYEEQYGASYSWDITANKDIDVRFEVRQKYQVRFTDTTFMLGVPNPDGQEFDAGVGYVRLCGFHADQGFYTVTDQHIKSMTMNGHALNMPDDSKISVIHKEETATTTVDGYTITIRVSYVSGLDSPDAEYKYTIDVRKTGGIYEDLVFAPVFEQMKKSELELCLYVNGQRRGDGVDVFLWNGAEASKQKDGDRYEMKSSTTIDRETKLFFFNVKTGYMLDGAPWAENAHNNDYAFYFETPDQIPEEWKMTGVHLRKWNNLNPLAAKQAAKEAGYQYSMRIAGDDTTDGRDQYKIHVKVKACDMYVNYEDNSGDPTVSGMPQGYFGAYEVDKDAHTMQAAPERKGYDFAGWRLKKVNAAEDTLYQPGQNFQITGANFSDAAQQTIEGKTDCWVYTFEAVWDKAKNMHRVEHYLPRMDGSYSDVPDLAHDCLTPNGDTKVIIIPIDGTTDSRFEYYEPDYEYSRAHGLISSPSSDAAPFTGTLKLFYKKIKTAYFDFTWTEQKGAEAYEDWFDREGEGYIWPVEERIGPFKMGEGWILPDPPEPPSQDMEFRGWRLTNDPSGKLYQPWDEEFLVSESNWQYAIHHKYEQPVGVIIPDEYVYEFYPVWEVPKKAYVDYVKTESQGTDAYEDWFDRQNHNYIWPDKNPDGPYDIGASVIMPEPPQPDTPGSTFMGWKLSNDPSGTIYKPGKAFVLTEENWQYAIHHEYEQPTGIIIPPQDKYEFYPVWETPTADLTISKKVTGHFGDQQKYFDFLLSGSGPNSESLRGRTFKVSGVEGMQEITFGQWNAPFKLKHGETMVIHGLPVGWTYNISEMEAVNYDTSVRLNGQMTSAKPEYGTTLQSVTLQKTGDTVEYINNCTIEPPATGVDLEQGGWLMMLLVAAAMGLVLFIGRRVHQQ